jgi:hypothetical protein
MPAQLHGDAHGEHRGLDTEHGDGEPEASA